MLSFNSTRRTQSENTRKTRLKPKAKGADAVNWDEDLNVDNKLYATEGLSYLRKEKREFGG